MGLMLVLKNIKNLFKKNLTIKEQAEKPKNTIDGKYGTSSQIDIYMFDNKDKAKLIAEDISHDFGIKSTGNNHNGSNWYNIIFERIKVTVFY